MKVLFALHVTLLSTILLFSPNIAKAYNFVFHDNFNYEQFQNWQTVSNNCKYNGIPAQWLIVNGKLSFNVNGGACSSFIVPSNLNLQQSENYSVEATVSLVNSINMDRNIIVKFKDLNNWYGLHFFGTNIYLDKVVNGLEYFLPNKHATYPFISGQDYVVKTTLFDSIFNIYLNEQLLYSINDTAPTFQNTTAGLAASSGSVSSSSVAFDDFIINQEVPSLPIPDLKQYSLPWGNMEYDTAHIWSPGKVEISRYGCAITSATMILQYYGFDVTPEILNTWLLNNNGYIFDGLVNWSAITRFAKLNHDLNPLLPKLEYSRNSFENYVMDANLELEIPEIVKIVRADGGTHFVVATGKSEDSYYMNDPATTSNLLSYYPSETLNRIDTFTPSNTDLSYLYFYATGNVDIEVYDKFESKITAGIDTESAYVDQTDQTLSSQKTITTFSLPKPSEGTYQIKIKGIGDYKTLARVYDIDANMTESGSVGVLNSGAVKTFFVDIGTLSKFNEVNFEYVRNNIKESYIAGKIKSKLVYNSLLALLKSAEKASISGKTTTAKKILNLLTLEVYLTKKHMDPTYNTSLIKLVGLLKESL